MSTGSTNSTQPTAASSGGKKMTFMSIYFLGINGIVGSGAFLLSGQIYGDMGVLSIVVLLIASLTVSMIALCYADLSSRFSGSGAAWLYTYNAFGRFPGYQIGLFSWFLGCLTLSAETTALMTTLSSIFPSINTPLIMHGVPIAIIVVLALINIAGSALVKIINNISSAFKIFTIIFFIVVGVFFVKASNFDPIVPTYITNASTLSTHFGSAFSIVFYMFTGFSIIPVAAGQMKNPEKNIPKALISVMITVTILYALVQAVVIGILGTSILDKANMSVPVAAAMKSSVGQWGYIVIVVGMLVSIFGVAFAFSFSTPALAASLANEHHLLPGAMGKKNKAGSPVVAIIVSSLISCALTSFDYIFLVGGIVLASFIQYVPSVLAVMKFKHTKQFPNHGFSLKGGYVIPVLALVISAYLLFNVKPDIFLLMIIVFAVGTLLYFTVIKKLDEPKAVTASKAGATAAVTSTSTAKSGTTTSTTTATKTATTSPSVGSTANDQAAPPSPPTTNTPPSTPSK